MRRLEITRLRGPMSVTVSFRRELPFLIEPLVNCELMPFAEESFDRFRREMAMARADVYDQRIRRGRRTRQRFAEARIHRLPNHMFDDGSIAEQMQQWP